MRDEAVEKLEELITGDRLVSKEEMEAFVDSMLKAAKAVDVVNLSMDSKVIVDVIKKMEGGVDE